MYSVAMPSNLTDPGICPVYPPPLSWRPWFWNIFYWSVVEELIARLHLISDPLGLMCDRISQTFYFGLADPVEIGQMIGRILSAKLFQHLPDQSITALTEYINTSFATGVFPKCRNDKCSLKTSLVIPLHKGGGLEDSCNFRPDSLL